MGNSAAVSLMGNLNTFRGSVYDAVVMLGCCGFGKHPTKVLDELLRITRPGKYKLDPSIIL